MLRILLSSLLVACLGGCVTTEYRYYGERDYRGYDPAAADSGYVGSAYDDYDYALDDTGYTGIGSSYYVYPDWFEYPAYYSIYWTINRNYVDPYWHPHFYYGVTWFPRNYFSISFGSYYSPYDVSHRWWPHYGYLSYSPYRLSWVDYYYDWYPWYSHYPRYHDHGDYYVPRYGSARNEAERLSRYTRYNPGRTPYFPDDGESSRRWDDRAWQRQDVIDRRESIRGADYYSRGDRRADPGVSGFRNDNDPRSPRYDGGRGSPRGQAPTSSERIDPRVSGFQNPRAPTSTAAPRGATPPPARGSGDVRREIDQRDRSRDDEGIPYPYRSTPTQSGRTYTGRGVGDTGGVRGEPRAPTSRTVDSGGWRSPTMSPPSSRYSTPQQPATRAPRDEGGYSLPRQTPRYTAPRQDDSYSAPREQPRYAPRESERYSAPRAQPEYSAPRGGGWSAPEPSRSRQADSYSRPEPSSPRFSAPEPREPSPRFSAPEPRESSPRFDPPERESRGESSDGGSARGEAARFRDDSER